MYGANETDLFDMGSVQISVVAYSQVEKANYRLDASAFLMTDGRIRMSFSQPSEWKLSDLANIYTIYIQTPVLNYVEPFAESRPYLTTSELGEYQQGIPSHVSLITDPRLIEWEVKPGYIILSRSGRVGDAYWIYRKIGGALVGDSFRVIPRDMRHGYFLYALLSSQYAKEYMTGLSYGSVVDHASVEHARALPIPHVEESAFAHIVSLIQAALSFRDFSYEQLDTASLELARCNGLPDLNIPGHSSFDPLGQPDCFNIQSDSINEPNGDGSEYRLDAHFYNPTAQQAVANIKNCRSVVKTVGEVAHGVLMGPRFKRNYVESTHGVPFLSGKNIVQIRPTDLKYLSNLQMADMQDLIIKKGWTLITCSGTIGRTCFVWENYENYAASQHILRVIPDESQIDPGYLYAFLSSRYGYEQILRYRHGSVIDEVTDKQIEHVLVPCPSRKDQEAIGDMVRAAYEKRAEAIRLEDEAQAILMSELTKAQASKGE